ncbi:hypothetical protein AgCh_023446 [Apium graveolens]
MSTLIVKSSAGDVLRANQTLKDEDTIVSADGEFELGFFSPGSSKNRYLSIRYKKAGGVIVWVANRDTPLTNASGELTLSSEGALELFNGTNSTIWSSNSLKSIKSPVAQLLNTGNLVIRTANDPDIGNFHWQSFDFPDSTLLPGMKLGKNLATGQDWSLSSWKSNDDPSPSNFQVELDFSGYPQIFLWNDSDRYFRTGPWNGVRLSGVPISGPNNIFVSKFVFNEDEIYYKYELISSSVLMRADYCDVYARCGAYGSCNIYSSSRSVLGCYMWHVCKHKKKIAEGEMIENEVDYGKEDLPFFDFRTIADATNNFSYNCKIGEGGFGPVYKGILEDGKEIAVKRRSACSTQGVEEFRNEVSCIAKLQHRNLVRLLGWSATEEGERMLVYEYMPNKSLDYFIFGDNENKASLNWPKRYNIINGIVKGLLYLHEDSRLRVIHRDLKASNILLDYHMNPKISDFGMARSFGDSETISNTARVVGTYGYMSPEYAIDGSFSIKSDVYSFGVLVIEIVSGKRNRFFTHSDHNLNLMGHAWKCYKEDRLSELIDASILESSDHDEAFRVILIGLLCVQQYPEDRPNMSSVLMMLTSKVTLPHPKQPGFFTERKHDEADTFHCILDLSSANQTITTVAAR